MKYKYIAIEGNIGAGKTTLAELLHRSLGGTFLPEEFEQNIFLPDYYRNPEQYAFQLEISFLLSRYRQMHSIAGKKDAPVIADYFFDKCRIFAGLSLKQEEFRLFMELFDMLQPQLPQPDIFIYLHVPADRLREKIRSRGRNYEQQISSAYLARIEKAYTAYLLEHSGRVIMIEHAEPDLKNRPERLRALLDLLEKDLQPGLHRLNFS